MYDSDLESQLWEAEKEREQISLLLQEIREIGNFCGEDPIAILREIKFYLLRENSRRVVCDHDFYIGLDIEKKRTVRICKKCGEFREI